MRHPHSANILVAALCSAALSAHAKPGVALPVQPQSASPAVPSLSAPPPFAHYSLVLAGGGLRTCSSQSRAHCTGQSRFAPQAKSSDLYAISVAAIRQISQSPLWQPERRIQLQQTQALLAQLLADFGPAAMTDTALLQRWRAATVPQTGTSVSGETLYQQLTSAELDLVLDMLQQPVLDERGQRRTEQASLAQSTDRDSVDVYKKISELAAAVSKSREKPLILVVTAASRDPLAAVDFYHSLFSETGARVGWLPLNAAYQAAQQHKTAGKASCSQLPQYLADLHGSYNRAAVYPDLMQQLTRFCQQGSAGAVALINQADAIFFNGGDQSLTLQALRLTDGSASAELQAIMKKLQAGTLIVAGTSAGTAVQAGGLFAGRPVPMISNGSSRQALQSGAVAAPAPPAGCQKSHSCPAELAEDQLTYRPQGGLGLFPFGVTDTHFSERGREVRLIRLLSDSKTRYGFGVDEATALLVGFDPHHPASARFGVVGAAGVFIADLAAAKASGSAANWQISQVRTHYLTRDDQAQLLNGELQLQLAPWKQPVAATAGAPIQHSSDILHQDQYRRQALQLCRSGVTQAQGQSPGVRVTLSRQPDSTAASARSPQQGQNAGLCSYTSFYLDIRR